MTSILMSHDSHYKPPKGPIPYARQSIDEADIDAVVATLRSDFVTQGPRLEWFEDGLKEATGARYAVAVSSGTAALHLSCLGLDIGEGDRGIVPAITFAATANALRLVGAEVVFSDVDPVSGLASSTDFSEALERCRGKAKAFFPVSFSGAVADLSAVAALAKGAGAFVVEDAAHSIGATYTRGDGSEAMSGSCRDSDAAVLSFHPVKHVCAGEGGAVTTNDEVLARRIRQLRSHGVERRERWRYDQISLGLNYRMTELQAALGHSQLKRLPTFLSRRREIAQRYVEAFSGAPFRDRIRIAHSGAASSRHLFVVHFAGAEEREAAYDYFHDVGIRAQVHYIPVYRHEYYRNDGHASLPGAETFYAGCLSLPLYPALEVEEQDYVIDRLRDFLAKRK